MPETTPPVRESPARGRPIPRWAIVAGAVILIVATWLVYRPSQHHGPRADNWWFWMHTLEQHDFCSILTRSYSYNRTSTVAPGDYALFRPVLFALLSAEKAWFGTNFVWWQRTGIALHLLVVGLAWALLARLVPRRQESVAGRWLLHGVAFAMMLFFAVNVANVEMVIWSHINAYMLFLALCLAAMLLLQRLLEQPERSLSWRLCHLFACFGLLSGAAFTYELGQFFAVVSGVVLAVDACLRRRPGQALTRFALLASVLLLYQGVDRLDRQAHHQAHRDVDFGDVVEGYSLDATLANTRRYLLFTVVQPFVPGGLLWSITGKQWSLASRLVYSEPGTVWPGHLRVDWLLAASLLTGTVLLLRAVAGPIALLRSPERRCRLLFLLLPASLLAMHSGITVLGRLNLRPDPGTLTSSTYYSYLPLLMLLIFAFGLWAVRAPGRITGLLDGAFIGTLLILATASGHMAHGINDTIKDHMRPFRLQVQTMRDLVEQQRHDPAFRFSFAPAVFHGCESFQGIPYPLILFGRTIDHDRPTHIIWQRGGKQCAESVRTYAAREGLAGPRSLATVTWLGPPYNVFRCAGLYHGLPHWDGYYRVERGDYHYLIQGATLDEVLARVPERAAEQKEHLASGVLISPHTDIHPLGEVDRGYALYLAGEFIYAIPEGDGPLEPVRLVNGRYSSWYNGTTLEEIQRQIDRDGVQR